MIDATICLPIRDEREISLGLKLQKVGAGLYNGYGGKRKGSETVEQTARRELKEEAGIEAEDLEKVAELTFLWPDKPDWTRWCMSTSRGAGKETFMLPSRRRFFPNGSRWAVCRITR